MKRDTQQRIITALGAVALTGAFICAGFALCCMEPTTEKLAEATRGEVTSPYSDAQLVELAVETRGFTIDDYGRKEGGNAAAEARLADAVMTAADAACSAEEGSQERGDLPWSAAARAAATSDAGSPDAVAALYGLAQAGQQYSFDESALSHLQDVNDVVKRASSPILGLGVLAAFCLFVAMFMFGIRTLARVLAWAGCLTLVPFALVGGWAALDFNGFFAFFHSLFFADGTWTFPYDSLLISLYPEGFWVGMGAVWLGTTCIAAIISALAGFILLRKLGKNPEALLIKERNRMLNSNLGTRVRFAPSPTGKLHIGGARTAIYNWAFARATGGTFILRIEDTDPERSTAENTQIILRALRWLGLDWDEGPETNGAFGPYFQTQRTDTYAAALEELKSRDAVYPCFCTKDELDAKRARAEQEEGGYAGYDRTCRDLPAEEAAARIAAGEPHVWRLRVPLDHGPIEFDDAVYGHMSFPADVMDDMIVVRSDGTPTYNFAVVCDDANMAITHVIRGDDHLSNTPRQILIYEALGRPVPTFAHLSMILGPDGRKLSKRHGAASVEEFAERGFLPDAMVNFLALLGWSLDGETTLIDRKTLCSAFSLDRITKKDAVFDETKLEWMNGQYLKTMGDDAWIRASLPWLAEAKAAGERIATGANVVAEQAPDEDAAVLTPAELQERVDALAADVAKRPDFYRGMYTLLRERETRLTEAAEKLPYLFAGKNVALDEKSVKKVLLKEGARADEALAACRGVIANLDVYWEFDEIEAACRALCEPMDMKPKALFQPLRVAVCGNMVSPPLFESIELLGRENTLARIDAVMRSVFGK